ncbi:MAG TPA: S1/P1 nuclease [Planctomycetota bacterium]
MRWPLLILACLGSASPAASPSVRAVTWSDQGHQVVAALAGGWLSTAGAARVAALLDGESLAQVAIWPDAIKDQRRWEWARPLHYVNLPRGKRRYRRARDCPLDACAVEALRSFVRLAADPEQPRAVRHAALSFLVHLAADLHQPLHAGYPDDQGGNQVRVAFDGTPGWRLHAVWDSGLPALETRGDWPAAAVRLGLAVSAGQIAAWGSELDPAAWAEESRALLLAHGYPGKEEITEGFVAINLPVVRARWQMAGVRLARLLEHVLGTAVDPATAPAWMRAPGPADAEIAAQLVASLG